MRPNANGKAQRSAAPPGPPGPKSAGSQGPPPAGGRGPAMPPVNAGNVNPKVVEELSLQLDSVRELYYNERASQMALSNLIREVQELREPEPILRRIKALQVGFGVRRQTPVRVGWLEPFCPRAHSFVSAPHQKLLHRAMAVWLAL